MSFAFVVAVAVSLAEPASLESAQAAFAEGEYDRAEALALAAASPPLAGGALYLAGLARFRAGRPGEALEALESAARADDPPPLPMWHYNRAGCLYELGRYAEAEAAYLDAARLDPSLAAISLVNAGFAALDGGSAMRARELAAKARSHASGVALDLVGDLEAQIAAIGSPAPSVEAGRTEYHQGLAAYDAGQFRKAREHFRRAAELEPAEGRNLLMAGAAALRLGARPQAREDLRRSLQLQLDSGDAEIARDYLGLLSPGLSARGRGLAIAAGFGTGFDNNVLQSGDARLDVAPMRNSSQLRSPLATATLGVTTRWRPGEALFAELAYGFDQLAYGATSASDYSLQQHLLTGALEWSLRDDLRLGASVTADVAFTGLASFRGLQASGNGKAWVALDESESASTRLEVEWSRKGALVSELSYLSGSRADVALLQDVRLGKSMLGASYRYRDERIGTLIQPDAPPPPLACLLDCAGQYVIPFGYSSHTAGAFGRTSIGRFRLGLDAGLEWRSYHGDSYIQVALLDGGTAQWNHRLREDLRLFAGALASLRLGSGLELTLRYDLVVNRSNVNSTRVEGPSPTCGPPEFRCHELDYAEKNYAKHLVTLAAGFGW